MKCKKKFVSFVLSLCMAVTATSIPVVSAVSTDKSASKASTTTVSTSQGKRLIRQFSEFVILKTRLQIL